MIWFWQHPNVRGLFNSGTCAARTFFHLAKSVCVKLGLEAQIRFVEMPSELHGKYQNFTQAEMNKLRAAGFAAPATTLEAGIKRYIAELTATESTA